ncbi:phospholipase A [Vibrio echinoideorum]|uniref:phospholipase A n=1 Tax=Vibrio echinoideorum TaxID=2100116 RepID=UPI0036F3EBA2
MGHYNFKTGYGGIEAGVSFPLLNHVRCYVQYFQGYGESLIDYDYNNQRIGVGILLTDII